jgi:hypothetical protein
MAGYFDIAKGLTNNAFGVDDESGALNPDNALAVHIFFL